MSEPTVGNPHVIVNPEPVRLEPVSALRSAKPDENGTLIATERDSSSREEVESDPEKQVDFAGNAGDSLEVDSSGLVSRLRAPNLPLSGSNDLPDNGLQAAPQAPVARGAARQGANLEAVCTHCGKKFQRSPKAARYSNARPACSKSCASSLASKSHPKGPMDWVVDGDEARLVLPCGRILRVDAADLPAVRPYRWWSKDNKTTRYARTHLGKRWIYVHAVLLGRAPQGCHCDHKDGDGLNNRRSNLRIATHGQNTQNQHKPRRRAYGVDHRTANCWQARCAGKYLGSFPTEELATQAYDSYAIAKYGPDAMTNARRRPSSSPFAATGGGRE